MSGGRATNTDVACLKEASSPRLGPERRRTMLVEKKKLTVDEIDSQAALELPDRETPALVVIGCVGVCVGQIKIHIDDVNVAANLCAQVLNITVLGASVFTCAVQNNQ